MIWRVRDRATFGAFARGERARHGPLSVTRVASPVGTGDDPPRVAYQVGKRVGGAVVRNRLRRRLRAAVRSNRARLRPGAAYLVGAAPEAADRPAADLSDMLGRLLDELEGKASK